MDGRTSVDSKFYRAVEVFDDLAGEANAYLNSGAYVIEDLGEPDEIGAPSGSLRIRQEPSLRISALAGDVVHNARAALDHLAYRLVERSGSVPTTKTYFPIAKDEKEWRGRYERDLAGASASDLSAVEGLAPWGGGYEDFYLLHRLNIIDKHRRLLTTLGRPGMQIATPFGHTLVLNGAEVAVDGERAQVPPAKDKGGFQSVPVMDLVIAPGAPMEVVPLRTLRDVVERIKTKVEPLIESVK